MACVCPTGTFFDGEFVDYYYCQAGACTANGTSYSKQYWANKTIICTNLDTGKGQYIDCDQLQGCCV
ncbi:hypothetical protein [Cohnella sp. REN36]|uniref:hypothetical protein n=1 Tax=Cohnella sp. REN36 TaxID=2887347 RepID=UPI001D13D0FC|nr:hypothetical protein [Cohnella sp. REN36]MCC3374574.1 hypothetical protein [Cohnella sp. REN36]